MRNMSEQKYKSVTSEKSVAKKLSSRSPGRLTAVEQTALIENEVCPVCSKPNIIRRPWREDFYCGQCQSVFRMVGETIHIQGHQSELN
jgi:hypothetical protein